MKEIYEEIWEESDYTEEQVKAACNHFFRSIKQEIEDPQYPKIMIRGLGSFNWSEYKVSKALRDRVLPNLGKNRMYSSWEKKKELYERILKMIKTKKPFKYLKNE